MQGMTEGKKAKHLFRPGVSGNPGGRPKTNHTNAWLMQAITDGTGKVIRDPRTGEEMTRYHRQMETLDSIARDPDHPLCVRAIELAWAYGRGLPPKSPNQLDYAEHFRQIQADRAKLAIALLGDRIKTMTSDEIAAHLAACSQDATAFLEIAKRYLTEDGTRPLIDSPQSSPGALEAAEQPEEGGGQVQDAASDSDE